MAIGELCSREVVCASPAASVKTAARLMREFHVGSVVVMDDPAGGRKPTGLVTDRDIAVAIVALGLDPEVIRIGDIMGLELVAVKEDAGIAEVVDIMRAKGLRRVVVTDAKGKLAGIVAADDILSLLAREMTALSHVPARERRHEVSARQSAG